METLFGPEPVKREKVRVSFRKDNTGEITAVFLDRIPMACYSHDGQHSACSAEWVRTTKPAKNYADLRRELEAIGYEIVVAKKMTYQKPGEITCPKCGARFKPNSEEYLSWCADEDRNLKQSFGKIEVKRMSLEEWAKKNHNCKNKKK
jgi:hypothetical protein